MRKGFWIIALLLCFAGAIASGLFGFLLFNGVEQHIVMAQLALLSSTSWMFAYTVFRIIAITSYQKPSASVKRARAGTASSEADPQSAGAWAKTPQTITGTLAIVMALFFGIMIILVFNLTLPFIVVAPFVLVFPLSYLAYIAFQRQLRIERLRRDFELLTAEWNETLFKQSQGIFNYGLHILLAILVTVLGLFILFMPLGTTGSEAASTFANLPISDVGLTPDVVRAMGFGFLGGFLFSVYLIYRRYTMYDLLPYVYLYCAISMLAGLIFNYMAFGALLHLSTTGTTEGAVSGIIDILAFSLGFFPILALQWLTRTAYTTLGQARRRSDMLPIDQIDGISQLHEVRLHDHGIDDAQNLASTDIPLLLINTTFSAQTVVDWVDQAILLVQLKTGEVENFRQAHIRTITDFRDLWQPLVEKERILRAKLYKADATKKAGVEAELKEVLDKQTDYATMVKSNVPMLNMLYNTTNFDTNIHYLTNYWRNVGLLLLPEWTNSHYNKYLLDALMLQGKAAEIEAELDSLLETVTQRQAEEPRVKPMTAEASAGLARLIAHSASDANLTTDEKARLTLEAIDQYIAALQCWQGFNAQIVELMSPLLHVNGDAARVEAVIEQVHTAQKSFIDVIGNLIPNAAA